jgi:hypothetical protein
VFVIGTRPPKTTPKSQVEFGRVRFSKLSIARLKWGGRADLNLKEEI